jgi:hypothetical protein
VAFKKNSLVTEAKSFADQAEEWLKADKYESMIERDDTEEFKADIRAYVDESYSSPDTVAIYTAGNIAMSAVHVSGFSGNGQTTVLIDLWADPKISHKRFKALYCGADRRVLNQYKSCIVYRKDYRGDWKESHRG